VEKPDSPRPRADLQAEIAALRAALDAARRERDDFAARYEALSESEEDLRDFYEHGAMGLQFVGPDGTILRANRAQFELLGCHEADLVGRKLSDFWADPAECESVMARLLQGVPLNNDECRIVGSAGIRDVLVASTPKHRGAELLYTRVFMRDITERNRAAQTANRLAAIVESSEDAIVSKDSQGIVISWNRGAEALFGYTAGEMIGQSIRKVIPADRQAEEDEVLRRIRAGERLEHYETVRQRKDGSFVDISLSVSPVKDPRGRIVGASKIARDITDRKRAEAAFRESMAAKEQFLSMVSHELRTPISIVLGVSRLLAARSDSLSEEERVQAFDDLITQSERLQEIIEHLLILTRMDAAYELSLEFMRVERLAEEVVAAWQRRHPGRDISVDIAADLPIAFGEPSLTRLVLDNLISNAIKYSAPETAVEVRIRAGEGPLVVEVLDRGIGLGATEMAEVFEPFFRSNAAREKAGGMGLGLAVCRKIVEAQGGTITVSPRTGGGTVFRFTVPRAEPD